MTKLKLKILAKPNFRMLTKIQIRNLNQASAANLKILTKPWAQNLDQILSSKYEQKFSFMTKAQLPNLQQTVANSILINNINNSNNLNKFWVGIFTYQGHHQSSLLNRS